MDSQLNKIHKVPQMLRQEECNRDDYDPKVVSFGPYHHGKEDLQLCQQAKDLSLEIFLDGSGKTRDFFLSEVMQVVARARNYYVDGSTDEYADEAFAEMMLLDGCFIIYYILIGVYSDIVDETWYFLVVKHLGGLVTYIIQRDIFLMENQIPFFILTLLIEARYKEAGREALYRFMHESIWGEYKQQQQQQQVDDHVAGQDEPLHLLEAFRRVLVWDRIPKIHAITVDDEQENFDFMMHHITFRSAKDLKAKGIHFRPSLHRSLEGISFESSALYGQLQLPKWCVSGLSKVFFLNMIAYEICPNSFVDRTVISYISFMKSLIDAPDDVKELREKRILVMDLGSDEEVVQLYRDLKTYGVGSVYSYREAKEQIQRHYDSKSKTWMAELIYKYLSTPWAIVAWFAALLILVLTFLQTYFTINPRR